MYKPKIEFTALYMRVKMHKF